MNALDSTTSLLSKLEEWLNQWMLKLFPAWYLSQVAKSLELSPIGNLNPASFLAHRWLSLQSVSTTLAQSLESQEAHWQSLAKQLSKLMQEKEVSKSYHLMAISGVEQSQYSDDWPSLIAYAEHASDMPEPISSNDEFNSKITETFPEKNRPHRIVYREWDGRAYWLNNEEPTLLAQLQQYGHINQRDGQFYAKIHIESLNTAVLDKIRHNWWLLVFDKRSILPFVKMAETAGLPILLGNFEWRRDDLTVLVAPKNNKILNRILLNLIHNRSTQEVIELGSYISRHHYPLTKTKKGGDNSPKSG